MNRTQQFLLTLLTSLALVGMLNAQSISCNAGGLQTSVDGNCEVMLTAAEVLSGTNIGNGPYTIMLKAGNRILESGSAPITIDGVDANGQTYLYIDRTLRVEIFSPNNSCWSNITFEDKLAPEFDVLNLSYSVGCSADLSCLAAPVAVDNCSSATVSFTESVIDNDLCTNGGRIIERVYTAVDASGNATTFSNQAVVTITITQDAVTFPRDIEWTCEQYACYSSITDASTRSAGIIDTNDDDMDGVTNTDDADVTQADDRITVGLVCNADDDDGFCAPFGERDLSNGAGCNTTATFNLTMQAGGTGISCMTPEVNGLEDDDILQTTGSGVPSVFTAAGACMYTVLHTDDTLSSCNSAAGLFKIRRTWRVINMCDNSILTDVQTISVVDKLDPVVTLPVQVDLTANTSASGPHGLCGSSGILPVPTLADNCSGIDTTSITVNTPAGQATPLIVGGQLVGYQIPAPFLALGGPYTVSYTVADNCGNISTATTQVFVEDNTPPVAICDEITNLSLTGTAASAVFASNLDDGSYDNCNDVWFKVIRMDELNANSTANTGSSTGLNCGSPNSENLGETTTRIFFDDRAFFCCDDISATNKMVVVRVFDTDPGNGAVNANRFLPTGDLFGTYNDCMVEVQVEDKIAPVKLLDAPDRTVVCTDNALRQQYTDVTNVTFDAPIFRDACEFTVTLQVIDGTTTCGDGVIRRRFQATDSEGNASVICEQVITSVLEHDYTIIWPRDEDRNMCVTGVLGDTLSRPNSLIEDACDLLAVSYVDQRFATNDNACYKILRTYDVINWCEWDGFSGPINITNPTFTTAGPRLDVVISQAGAQDVRVNFNPAALTSVGRWSYVQHIKVYDEEDPILGTITQAPCEATDVVDNVGTFGCGQTISVDFELIDNCGGLAPPTYRLVAFTGDVDGDGQISAAELAAGVSYTNDPFGGTLSAPAGSTSSVAQSGTFTIAGTYPIGEHVFVVRTRDLCGNEAEYYIPFTATDCKAPTPKIRSFLSIGIMANGMVSCVADHLDNGSFDGCGPVRFSYSADVNDTIRTFTCAELGSNTVQFWVTDASDNQTFVTADIDVQDNMMICSTPNPRIAGNLSTEAGDGVENVRITANGGYFASMTTPASGAFEFQNVTRGADVTLTPTRLDQVANGITTYDLYLISQHVLGLSPLTAPAQLIAADASNNGRISAFDMTVIRRVLLGLDADFANNTSWRFIDANYSFPNPSNPWQETFPEIINYNDISQNMMNTDFTAVKVGDVNHSASANSRQVLAPRTLVGEFALEAKDAVLAQGETQLVTFTASDIEALGYQLTLEWDADAIEVANVIAGSHSASGFGTHLLSEGKLTMSHNGDMKGELFTLEVRALRDGIALSEVLSAGNSVTTAEAFAKTGPTSVSVRFSGQASGVANALEQNRPNPFAGTTQIGFTLAEAGAASLTVTDVTGRVVWRTSGQFDAGHSQIEIAAGELPAAGLLNYTLTAGDFTATRKMVVIN